MLALDHNPYTRLHTSQSRPAGAPYSLSIVNATPLAASVAFFTVTVVNPGELTLTLQEALLPHELRFAQTRSTDAMGEASRARRT